MILFFMKGKDMAKKKKNQQWTKDDIKKLRKLYRKNSTTDTAKELGRTYAATQAKAAQLGITKTKKYLKSVGLAK
jgi:hypothetical protein